MISHHLTSAQSELQWRYGEHLFCVVEHADETQSRLHYVLVQLANKGFETVRKGYAVQLEWPRAFYA